MNFPLGHQKYVNYAAEKIERKNWTRENYLARLLIRVYNANESKGGLFYTTPADEVLRDIRLRKIWGVYLVCKDAWLTKNRKPHDYTPPARVYGRHSLSQIKFVRKRVFANNQGGLLTVVWDRPNGPPKAARIDNIGRKSWTEVMDQITETLDLTIEEILDLGVYVAET